MQDFDFFSLYLFLAAIVNSNFKKLILTLLKTIHYVIVDLEEQLHLQQLRN